MKKYMLFAAAALTLAACTNENDPVTPADGEVAARIVADIDHVATRASGTDWVQDDRIGISCTSTDNKTTYTNIPYKWDDQEKIFKSDGTVIYFQSAAKVTFNAYYPYAGTSGMVPDLINVTTDADAQKNQPQIDFLFAQGAETDKNNQTVNFTGENAFRHCMSRITIELTEGNNMYFEGNLTSYTLKGLNLKGKFNTATGEAVVTEGTAPKEGLEIKLENVTVSDKKYTAPSVIVFPQDVNGTIALEVTVDRETYRATLVIPDADKNEVRDTDLKSGYNYKFPVRVTKMGLSVGTCQIADWDTATGDSTDATL